jgi:hypothetical protein
MKHKDIGNKQRYDPVSKRMITIHPETPGVSGVTLISISQPVFEDTSFVSEYTVTFRRYDGCLSFGNEVTCFIYNSAGTQVAKTVATLKQGVNTLVLKGGHTPRLNEYYASVVYGLTAFNSNPRRLIPDFPIISSVSATTSSVNFYQNNEVSADWSYDNSFFWTGTLNISFVSYDTDGSPATLSVKNITDSPDEYPLIVSNPNFNLSYGRNTITLPNITIINIPTGSGRTRVPYKDTEILTVSITYLGETYSGNIVVRPTLIQDVVFDFPENSYWIGSTLYSPSRIRYRYADDSQSMMRDPDAELILYDGAPFGSHQIVTFYQTYSDGREYEFVINDLGIVRQLRRFNRIGTYEYRAVLPLVNVDRGLFGIVTYDNPSFSVVPSYDQRPLTVVKSNTLLPVSEITAPPNIVCENVNINYESLLLTADFTVTFNYQPRNTPQTSSELTLRSEFGVTTTQSANLVVGPNTVYFENITVIPGAAYTAFIPTGSVVSTTNPIIVPTYEPFRFTSVPNEISPPINYTTSDYIPFSITLSWTNTIPYYVGGTVIIETVGLAYGEGRFQTGFLSPGDSSITFNIDPNNPDSSTNPVERAIARNIVEFFNWEFRFRLTTEENVTLLSSKIRLNASFA